MVLCKSKVFCGANIVWITSFLSLALVKKKVLPIYLSVAKLYAIED